MHARPRRTVVPRRKTLQVPNGSPNGVTPARRRTRAATVMLALAASALSMTAIGAPAHAEGGPTMLDPKLAVRTAATGLTSPTGLAFIGDNDMFVLEKTTGRIQRVVNGAVASTPLDLAVNSGSERGLLGIALHPNFPANPGVYLYWTESTTGADTTVLSETPLLGNRVDRFLWNGSTLTFDRNLIRIRARQEDAGQPARANHNGGVIDFGRDGKLYTFTGDLGRRGHLQNLTCGPTAVCPGPTVPDDQFGGPQTDNAHLSGVVLRLNDDGTTPTDNPFYGPGAAMGGEVGATLQKIFSYGHRNGFGMAVDPDTGNVWMQENGDDSFSEINRLEPGMNGGWIQIAGPVQRVAQFKEIETTFGGQNLQQLRWPPSNIADSTQQALGRLYMLPGAHYSDPEFSWKWEVAPGGMGFLNSRALGAQFKGDLFMGAATPALNGGYLFHFNLTGNGQKIAVDDPRLNDRVADNLAKHEITESESLLIGRDFGVVTDIETAPDGNLSVLSLTNGAVYTVYRR
ncbi:PQQ-dependent sugar dehydrogenase [Micromonospora cremea]|uniref:Glucose/arabinose dehydrogenase, beta-propeller fold n=1 Tax=Micromonospora cremea TaxID=709881 RepID=A0A1N5U1L2_9ACTN|nr:PQQ-dependent sugar dehydrogenase [Micromonospora cremea]SIM53939.1 Glucose/arabinose dehydrogenase, beta-propeller fold [Micromonospora cremea]